MSTASLTLFHPLISEWFSNRYSKPTPIQSAAWPRIHSGENLLITAPTGSGKTLTAFLAALDKLVTGECPVGSTSVLYVSPMKALNNDIQRNLIGPLGEIRKLFSEHDEPFPEITVATRSGDTPSADRQRMLSNPPEILITTPESLNIILSSPRAREILFGVTTVILDEIHAVVGTKRGTHLITAIDRLARHAGEFQRIAVSATVRPMELVARFVGGYRRISGPAEAWEARTVGIVEAPDEKEIRIAVDMARRPELDGESYWDTLVPEIRSIIDRNRSTLVFVTTRTHAEKLTLLLNDGLEEPLAYSHHGSLARELRHFVEQALKEGRLRAIVATNSLELGIDIGDLDEVVLVKTPPEVAATLQRVGRAGHRVSEPSVGTLFPLNGHDAVAAAVMTRAALAREIEPVRPVRTPLDVLAQVLTSMVVVETWRLDDLYDAIRTSWPYHELERSTFDLVLEMLAGKFAQVRIRELRPRVVIDPIEQTVRAGSGASMLLYRSGGTIPDRGDFGLRIQGGGTIGELDEEFVWERRVGHSFALGSQVWTITEINDKDVVVVPAAPGTPQTPFWKAEPQNRSLHYSERLLDFLEQCDRRCADGTLEAWLSDMEFLSDKVREAIADHLSGQRAATGVGLPHRHRIVMESFVPGRRPRSRSAGLSGTQVVVHAPWGGTLVRPLAVALATRFYRMHHFEIEMFANNDCMAFLLPEGLEPEEVFSRSVCSELSTTGELERLLREGLEQTAMFRSLFRENAGRALLLPRADFNKRVPRWLNRMRSRRLLGAIAAFSDFPILLETWRECLSDFFDLDALHGLLIDMANGEIAIESCSTQSPSPFSSEIVWRQTDSHVYRDDSSPGAGPTETSDDLIRQVLYNDALRPMIPDEIIAEVEARLQRLRPGYAPREGDELLSWVAERVALTATEATQLREVIERDSGQIIEGDESPFTAEVVLRLCWVRSRSGTLLTTIDRLPALNAVLGLAVDDIASASHEWSIPPRSWKVNPTAADAIARQLELEAPPALSVLTEWLQFFGPRSIDWPVDALGLEPEAWESVRDELSDTGQIVMGRISSSATEEELCAAEVLEYLLRLKRKRERPVFKEVDQSAFVPFLADQTSVGTGGADPDALLAVLDRMFGYPCPASGWESDLIPSRVSGYYPIWLDGLVKEHGLVWIGCGKERVTLCLEEELDLFQAIGRAPEEAPEPDCSIERLLGKEGPLGYGEIRDRLGLSGDQTEESLWRLAWAGTVTNSSFATLRKGLLSGFTGEAAATRSGKRRWPGRQPSRQRSRSQTRPITGTWWLVAPGEETDPLIDLENDKERVRALLRRYGIVFRRLVGRELPHLRWSSLFKALRLMELSGEVVAGSFVGGADLPQFALPGVLERLAAEPRKDVYWISALDPASPCGLCLDTAYPDLPARLPGNHLVFRGSELVMTSTRYGADLLFHVEPDDPDIGEILGPLTNMVTRKWNPRRVSVETVNGLPVRDSPYSQPLERHGFRNEFRSFVLDAGYR